MKILFLFYDFKIGGAQKSLFDWLEYLREYYPKFDISVVVISAKAKNLNIDNKINFIYLKSSRLRHSISSLNQIVKKINPTYVVTTMFGTGLICLTIKIFFNHSIKYIYREATNILKARNVINRLLTFLIIFFSEKTTFNSILQSKYYRKYFKKKIYYVPNYTNTSIRVETIKPKKIIMVGRSNKVKRFEFGINLVMNHTDEKLVVFTTDHDKKYLDYIKNLVKKNNWNSRVEIIINEKDSDVIFNSGDVLLITSWFEGSPNILYEGISYKNNIVTTDFDYGPRETFEDYNYPGLLKKNLNLKDEFKEILQKVREYKKYETYNNIINNKNENFKSSIRELFKN